jgi:hypothetical protein
VSPTFIDTDEELTFSAEALFLSLDKWENE